MVHIHIRSESGKIANFEVCKTLLCARSPYLAAALEGVLPEVDGAYHLEIEDTTAKIFRLVAHWIFKPAIFEKEHNLPCFADLVDLWLLAEKLMVSDLQNAAMRGMGVQSHRTFALPLEALERAYRNAVKDSFLRLYLAEEFAYRVVWKSQSYPHGLFADMGKAFQKSIITINDCPANPENIVKFLL